MVNSKKKSGIRIVIRWLLRIIFFLLIITTLQTLVLRFVNPPFTVNMAWKWLASLGDDEISNLGSTWRALKDVSPNIRKCVLAGEDQRFLSHHGFDLVEMNKAITDMILKKGNRGASTITMQVARTVFLWPARSWFRKAAEAYYTILIEVFWSKERILEIYLNTVDWGTNVIGVEAASRKYFFKSCSYLPPSQAALLVAILPNPHKWSPTNPSSYVQKRKRRILKEMKKMPLLSN